MSHIWMSPVTHANKSCHTHEWVMSHIWMSHVTHMNKSCHTHKMSHVTYMDESCYTYEWVMSHIGMSHVTHVNESCHKYEWVTSHTCLVWYLSLFYGTHMNESRHTRALWHIWMSHVTLVLCVMSLPVLWHIYEWVMSHIWMSHVKHMNESCHIYEWVMSHTSHIWMSQVTHMNKSCREGVMSYMSHVTHTWIRHDTHIDERVPAVRSAPKRGVASRSSRLIVSDLNELCHE